MHTASVDRRKIRVHDSKLSCDAIKGVGWYATCACGWIDLRPYRDRDTAREAAQAHRDAYRSCGL